MHYVDTDSVDNDQLNMHQAWSDLSYIEHEQERYVALRSKTVSELDAVRQQAVALENVISAWCLKEIREYVIKKIHFLSPRTFQNV